MVSSARSRVKGHLELYHAYIREPNASGSTDEEPTASEGDPDWEMVEPETSSQTAETPSQVGA